MTTRGLTGYGCNGELTIDGLSMNTPAWDVPDLTPLWLNFDVRGEDRLIPGAPGVVPYRRRLTVTRYDLRMLISGDVDEDGDEQSDAWIGLEDNLETLRAIAEPTNVGDGTRVAVLTMPSGATREADVHVLGITTGQVSARGSTRTLLRAVLGLSVPAGRFVAAGS